MHVKKMSYLFIFYVGNIYQLKFVMSTCYLNNVIQRGL